MSILLSITYVELTLNINSYIDITSRFRYFFLVKYRDAKSYSYDDIYAKKKYEVFVVTKNSNGDFDRNIKYRDQ